MRIRTLVLAAAVVVGVVNPPDAVARAAVSVRYASPEGSGTVCTHAEPCLIVEAVDQAPSKSEIVVEPGHYGTVAHPLDTELTDATTSHLMIHGEAGQRMPVIHSTADYAFNLASSSLSDVHVIASGGTGGVLGTTGDHLIVEATDTIDGACSFTVTLSESLCIGSGKTTDAIKYSIPGSRLITIDNVTAVALGSHATAFSVDETGAGDSQIDVSSSVFSGAGHDLGVFAATGGQVEVNLSHSRSKTRAPVPTGGGMTTIHDDGGNITAAAKFVAVASGNYREKPRSPTVDAGAPDPSSTTDLADEPRSLGDGPDMGAYELLIAPRLSAFHVKQHTAHTITASVTVTSNGLPSTVRLYAVHKSHTTKSHRVSIGAGTPPMAVTLAVHGLHGKKKYTVYAEVRSDGGRDRSPKATVHTA